MTRTKTKICIAVLVVLPAMMYLGYAGVTAGRSYYLSVDDFIGAPEYHDQQVRLYGIVASEQLVVDHENLRLSFLLEGETQTLSIEYEGVVPELFQVGGEVVVRGRMGDDNVFGADELLTKCASKYEMKSGEAGTSE